MTPKEKAIELVDKMYHYQWREKQRAKECALIAVQELIDQCWSYREIDLGMSLEYWEEVREEIEKL
jgi:hypothetical protein